MYKSFIYLDEIHLFQNFLLDNDIEHYCLGYSDGLYAYHHQSMLLHMFVDDLELSNSVELGQD